MAQNDYAVVVGINTYPSLGNLQGPAHDGRDFYEWLYAADGGNVPDANITTIISPDYPNVPAVEQVQPRIKDVEDAFERIALQLRQSGQQAGRLYLYLAGHGFSKEVDEAALLMAHAVKGVTTNLHIAGRAYANRFSKSSWFREVVLLMDCCREDFKSDDAAAARDRRHQRRQSGRDAVRLRHHVVALLAGRSVGCAAEGARDLHPGALGRTARRCGARREQPGLAERPHRVRARIREEVGVAAPGRPEGAVAE